MSFYWLTYKQSREQGRGVKKCQKGCMNMDKLLDLTLAKASIQLTLAAVA